MKFQDIPEYPPNKSRKCRLDITRSYFTIVFEKWYIGKRCKMRK